MLVVFFPQLVSFLGQINRNWLQSQEFPVIMATPTDGGGQDGTRDSNRLQELGTSFIWIAFQFLRSWRKIPKLTSNFVLLSEEEEGVSGSSTTVPIASTTAEDGGVCQEDNSSGDVSTASSMSTTENKNTIGISIQSTIFKSPLSWFVHQEKKWNACAWYFDSTETFNLYGVTFCNRCSNL